MFNGSEPVATGAPVGSSVPVPALMPKVRIWLLGPAAEYRKPATIEQPTEISVTAAWPMVPDVLLTEHTSRSVDG